MLKDNKNLPQIIISIQEVMDGDYAFLLKIVLLGCPRAGKSAFLRIYTDEAFEVNEYTYDYDFVRTIKRIKTKEVQGKLVKLQIWDASAIERFRSIRRTYFKSTHGFAIIIDLTNPDSFDSALYWKNEIGNYFVGNTPEIILIGNKADLENERFFTFEEGKKFADSLGLFYIEVSAKTIWNVEKSFEILLRKIIHRYEKSNNYV